MDIAQFYEKYFGKQHVDKSHPKLDAFLADLYHYYQDDLHRGQSISSVLDGIRYILAYSKDVKQRRSRLYWAAKEDGQECKANMHLPYYSNADTLEKLALQMKEIIDKVY